MSTRKYELRTNAPAPMAWDAYRSWLQLEWSTLLERVTQQDSFDEGSIQRFLEQHPCLIPGAFPEGTTSHAPFPGAVITQPSLVGTRERIPDFMWLATDSTTFQPTLIEIESPNKPWWTDNGTQHHKFTQAWEQLQEWRAWFANPINVQQFLITYRLPWIWSRRVVHPRYMLVYGRRDEANRNDWLMQKRAQKGDADMIAMTYDRLSPQADASNFLCVRLDFERYVAVSVPPTLRLGPRDADYMAAIKEKEAAAASNSYLGNDRKRFLIERFPYWDALVAEGLGVHFTDDWE